VVEQALEDGRLSCSGLMNFKAIPGNESAPILSRGANFGDGKTGTKISDQFPAVSRVATPEQQA